MRAQVAVVLRAALPVAGVVMMGCVHSQDFTGWTAEVGPLQAIAPGPTQAIVFKLEPAGDIAPDEPDLLLVKGEREMGSMLLLKGGTTVVVPVELLLLAEREQDGTLWVRLEHLSLRLIPPTD